MGSERFKSFCVLFLETDLWIGVTPKQYDPSMERFVYQLIVELRTALDTYISQHPMFGKSLVPYPAIESASAICHQMADAAFKANVGPMAAVAGAVACEVGKRLKERYGVDEVIVENGGDIYFDVMNDVTIATFAGESPLSEKVGLRIPASHSPLGVCTSSGTVGHSLSFGKADAVVVACYNASLSDAYATAIANTIQSPEDIEPRLDKLENNEDLLAVLIICKDKLGVRGTFELTLFGLEA